MPAHERLDRLGRALVPVIGALLIIATVGVVVHDDMDAESAADSAVPTTALSSAPRDDPPADGGVPVDGAGEPSVPPSDATQATSTTSTTVALGRSAVPAEGTYRYEIDSVRDGEVASRIETREIRALGESDGVTEVQIVAASDGERQVSIFDWSPNAAIVRSTRIETDGQTSQECTWDPPFVEFGALEPAASWSVDSRCTTDVGGLTTDFVVTGGGGVAGEVEVVHAGRRVRAWQVERSRTTVITAIVGGDTLEQRVEETGTFFVDPARGLVLRSDVTVSLSGSQQGETRRTSVLVE